MTLQPSSCYLKLEFQSVWDFCLLLFLLQGETLFPPAGDSDMPAMPSGAKPRHSCLLENVSIIAMATVLPSAQSRDTGEKKMPLIVYLPFANMQK